jgi:hypothetical protein
MTDHEINIMILTHLLIVLGGFIVPWALGLLYCAILEATAWMRDSEFRMDDTAFAKWLNAVIRRPYSTDYYCDAAQASLYILLATVAGVLIYHFWPLRALVAIIICIFVGMHAGRWMIRTAKALSKVKDVAHQHDSEEKEG